MLVAALVCCMRGSSFAEQMFFSPRESAIFAALTQQQEREGAIRDSLKKAQGKLLETRVIREKKISALFKDFSKKVHPFVIHSVTHNGNIDSTQHDHKDAFINDLSVGSKVNFIERGRQVNFDAEVHANHYNHGLRRRANNDSGASLGVRSNFGIDRFTVALSNEMSTNRSRARAFCIETEGAAYYWQNSFAAILGRHFNRIGFDAGYTRSTARYDHSPTHMQNNYSEVYAFSQYLRLATKTKLLFTYNHGRVQYQHKPIPSPNYNYDYYTLDLASTLSYKLSGLLNVGYKIMDYKTGIDYKDLLWGLSLGYRLSDRTNLAFAFGHTSHEQSETTGYSETNGFSLTGTHRLAFNPRLSTSFGVATSYVTQPKTHDYKQRSISYAWGNGLNYAFRKWLSFNLDFENTKAYSNFSTKYRNKTIVLSTEAKF